MPVATETIGDLDNRRYGPTRRGPRYRWILLDRALCEHPSWAGADALAAPGRRHRSPDSTGSRMTAAHLLTRRQGGETRPIERIGSRPGAMARSGRSAARGVGWLAARDWDPATKRPAGRLRRAAPR